MMKLIRSSALLSAILVYYFSTIVYRDNADFFESSFPYIALLLLPVFLFATVIFWLPSLALKSSWKEKYSVILSSVSIIGLFIGIFLIFERGLLDGQQELKVDSVLYQWGELICAVLALALLIKAGWKWPKIHSQASLFLLLLTAGLCAFTLIAEKKQYRQKKAPETLLRASSYKNIFVILFDAFQSDLFDEIIRKNQTLRKHLEGFTFFKNTASVSPTTYFAMPAIHSGTIYSLDQSMAAYYEEGIRKNSFLTRLAQKGYEAAMVNSVRPCPIGASCGSMGELIDSFWAPVVRDASLLLDISFYRFAPSFFKATIYNHGGWRITKFMKVKRAASNIDLFKQFSNHLLPTTDRPVVKLLHFYFTHPPAEVDAQCGPIDIQKWNWERGRAQSECAITLYAEFLQNLKTLGLYDNSLIILVSDHGSGLTRNGEPRMMARARSLLLIKPFGERGDLEISDKAVHIADIPRTICHLSGECSYENGKSAFEEELNNRTTSFLEYTWQDKYWYAKKIPIQTIWNISGPVDSIFSWYKRISPDEIKEPRLDFSVQDSDVPFGFGWLPPELQGKRTMRWASDGYAQLFLPLQQDQNTRIEMEVFTHSRLQNQRMALYLENSRIAEISVAPKWQVIHFDLAGETIVNPVSRLTFEFKKRESTRERPDTPVTVAFDSLRVVSPTRH